MKKEMQHKTTLSNDKVVEDIDTFSQTLMRQLPEFKAHCGKVFTQFKGTRLLSQR